MSKTKVISALVAGLGALVISSGAQAVVLTTGTPILTTVCVDATNQILTNNVTVNTSKGVSMGYVCRLANATASPPTVNRVGLGACHVGGTAKARDVACTGSAQDGDLSPAGCTDADVAANPPNKKPVSGVSIFYAATSGGVIGEDGMASTLCNAAGVSGLVEGQYP